MKVNETDTIDDDYIPVEKPVGARDEPQGTPNYLHLVSGANMSAAWVLDDPSGIDEDVSADATLPYLFEIDTPGFPSLSQSWTDDRAMQKAKFRSWVEVLVGGKWYVISPYKEWYSIIHADYVDSVGHWIEDLTGKVTEIKEGSDGLSNYAGTWPGGWQPGYY